MSESNEPDWAFEAGSYAEESLEITLRRENKWVWDRLDAEIEQRCAAEAERDELRREVSGLTAQRDSALADIALFEQQRDDLRRRIEAAHALLDEYEERGDFKWGIMHLRAALGDGKRR